MQCCNQKRGSLKNPSNIKKQGQLQPGKLGDFTQSCFNINKLPNIETLDELSFELCNIQQAFDKCPQYYTKSNYDDLINTITKSFFHLYVKTLEDVDTPWFEGYAEINTDPIEKSKLDKKDFPGFYLINNIGAYSQFKDINGQVLVVEQNELEDQVLFFKPVIENNKFLGYEKVFSKLESINKIYNKINDIYIQIEELKSAKHVVLQQSVTYEELINLINNNNLNPGQEYKIIDYTFTTVDRYSSSAKHDFDIIVTAINTNTLSEYAKAVIKENDDYFKNNKLNLWQLKYSVYNDKYKYKWADEINGKGVIYWLKDEFGNEAGYDFKSALFNHCVSLSDPTNIEQGVSVEECEEYLTFCNFSNSLKDESLSGNFKNCIINFNDNLPRIKLINSGSNFNLNGMSLYIGPNSYNITIEGSVNYIEYSNNLNLCTSNTIVSNSHNIKTLRQNSFNIISRCQDVQFGYNNSSNFLHGCQNLVLGSTVKSLKVYNWFGCKIGNWVSNITSKDIELESSFIDSNNKNVIFQGSDIFQNKTVSSGTFTESTIQEFKFNPNIRYEKEIISKKQFITYID